MALARHTISNAAIIRVTYLSLLMSFSCIPCNAILFSLPTFESGEIFVGSYYSGTCVQGSGNYSRGFQSNLLTAFSNLTSVAVISTFYTAESGIGQDKVFASFHCFRDVEPAVCLTCVQNLTEVITEKCQTKEAIVYGSQCDLFYSYRLGSMEDDTTSHLFCNGEDPKVPDPSSLNRTVINSMEGFINGVNISSGVGYYYHAGIASLWYLDQKVYSIVRCTPDVDGQKCKECLMRGLNETLLCLNMGSTFGTDYRSHCAFRYDIKPFGDFESPAPVLSPIAGQSSSSSDQPNSAPNSSNNPFEIYGSGGSLSLLCLIAVAIILVA